MCNALYGFLSTLQHQSYKIIVEFVWGRCRFVHFTHEYTITFPHWLEGAKH